MPIDAHEKNRLSWNSASERHNLHKGDQAKFFRDGGSTLFPEDIELLGDVRGKTLLHLQCNCGQDTLSIAKHLGADVTGVDISDYAIGFARKLSEGSEVPATFVRDDVFDYCESDVAQQFDVVYTSYGATNWISDIDRWGRGVASVLKPGGRFVKIEFHPILGMLHIEDFNRIDYDYMGGKAIVEDEGVGDYVGESGEGLRWGNKEVIELPPFQNPHPCHAYEWGIGETFSALTKAGIRVETLVEYPYANGWKGYADMIDLPGNRKTFPEGAPVLPLMYSIAGTRV